MKYISLFSGIGGFDLSFERAGMECVAVCEIDKNAQSVLRRHFPRAELFDDVRKVGTATHERKSIDLICGGFPCQDVSIAGKREGLAGERSGLWFEFARVINELEPSWVVIENVPGLLSSNKGKDFAVIVRWLAQRGYGVAWRVLDAQYFGVPQRRRRVFIVGSFGNGRCAEVLFESESMSGNTPPRREARKEHSRGIETGSFIPGNSANARSIGAVKNLSVTVKGDGGGTKPHIYQWASGGGDDLKDNAQSLRSGAEHSYQIVVAPPVVMAHGQANAEIVSDGSPSLTANHEAPILWEMSHASEAVRESGKVVPTLQARMGTGGNQVPMVSTWTIRGGKEGGGKGFLASEDKAMTLGGQPQWLGIRRLTPTECLRLQGFPDDWLDGESDTQKYKQCGNAVAVPVAEWIARRIMSITKLPIDSSGSVI